MTDFHMERDFLKSFDRLYEKGNVGGNGLAVMYKTDRGAGFGITNADDLITAASLADFIAFALNQTKGNDLEMALMDIVGQLQDIRENNAD